MTQADLKRLEELRGEICRLKTNLEAIRNASVISATAYSQANAKSGIGDPVSRIVENADDLEYKIQMLKEEGYGILRDVESENLKQALSLYFVECLPSWAAVSRAMGKQRTYAARMYKKFKKAVDNASTNCYN